MSAMSGQGAGLLFSFQSATKQACLGDGVVTIPVPANQDDVAGETASIFRTTEK
jgi:hypothetical protein